jgi:cobalt-zinc-cadmium efflux system outer membrane protein
MSPGLPHLRWQHCILCLCACWVLVVGKACAQQVEKLPALQAKVATPVLSREAAVRWALESNPELTAVRQQYGVANAGVIIANTYPFNPMLESRVEWDGGPESAFVSNYVLNEHKVLLELELRGQAGFRRQAAIAALTRTEWEIAYQEIVVAARVLRAFDGVLYRYEKRRLNDERIRLNQQAADQIRKLREQGKLSPADLILIQTEVDDANAQRGGADLAVTTAEYELRRAIGTVQDSWVVAGEMQGPLSGVDSAGLLARALERRPDLRARQVAIAEAEARVRLENSNRYGNPVIGPSFGYDPTRVVSGGVTMVIPLPALNSHRGEILQRQAEQARAAQDFRQAEVQVQQDVQSALARMERAQEWVESYSKKVLPNLRKGLEAAEKLFAQGEPSVDVVRVLEIRRNVLKGQEAYLDALWELSQANDDLVAAVGDLGLILGPNDVPALPAPRQLPGK